MQAARSQFRIDPPADKLRRDYFQQLSRFIFDYSGIRMPDGKQTMLEGRLRRRVRLLGLDTLDEYARYVLVDGHLDEESVHLINAVTTNKTDFFREPAHFDFLRDIALPKLAASADGAIRAWSCACSSGQEPYSMAMVIDDFLTTARGPRYGLLATDLDTEMLETARAGIYQKQQVAPVPERLRRKYVMHSREKARAEVRIIPALRSAIGYARLNLMDDSYPVGEGMHVIFCRNVLIYFDKETQRKVISRLVDCLAPGGYLFLGHSESIGDFDIPIRQVGNTVFARD